MDDKHDENAFNFERVATGSSLKLEGGERYEVTVSLQNSGAHADRNKKPRIEYV